MDIFGRFKQHYAHYFLGVIIPAVINGLSVPLLKHFLGPAAYGRYALYFNMMLIINLLVCGWLWQGVLRFTARIGDRTTFARHIFQLSLIAPAVLFVPTVLLTWYWSHHFSLSILFAATLLAAAIQLPRQALLQANFHSTTTVRAEAVRTISWLILITLIILFQLSGLAALFGALLISYSLSTGYLYLKSPFHRNHQPSLSTISSKETALPMLRYGLPFSLWYVVFYLVTYIDKTFMLAHFGPVIQGNYNALFDFTAKALILLLSPVLIATTPLLSDAYEKGQYQIARKLLQKLIWYELLAMVVAVIGFWLLGYQLIFSLLHIPPIATYKRMGTLVIAGTFLWQIALLLQKRFELLLKSRILLIGITMSLACQWLFYMFVKWQTPAFVPAGFLLSAIFYLVFLLLMDRFTKKTKN